MQLPGLIDPHVHLRDPGQTEKEDFYTGTSAALAGGYTSILDMPNNKTPIISRTTLEEKIKIAKEKIVCDVGFHFGSMGDNLDEFPKVTGYSSSGALAESRSTSSRQARTIKSLVLGLKLYLNQTTGNFLLDKSHLEKIFAAWPKELPILVHAEDTTFDDVLEVVKEHPRKLHLCHMSTKYELTRVIEAKEAGLPVTCGVTPHHLFLTENDLNHLSAFGMMRPPLRSREDVDFLWKHLSMIDLIESDHAPHTKEEKQNPPAGGPTPFGVPGLETTLPLLLTAVSQGRLSLEQVVKLCHDNPSKIFNIPKIPNTPKTTVEIDMESTYEIKNENLFTKCKWSPFDGWKVKGRVRRVFLREEKVFEDGKVLAAPGSGNIITPHNTLGVVAIPPGRWKRGYT